LVTAPENVIQMDGRRETTGHVASAGTISSIHRESFFP